MNKNKPNIDTNTNKYTPKNVLANLLSGIALIYSLANYFNKYPKMLSLSIVGRAIVDDSELCHEVDYIKINGRKSRVIDYSQISNKPLWMLPGEEKEFVELCQGLIVVIADGSEIEDAEIVIEREDFEGLLPFINIIKSTYDLVS